MNRRSILQALAAVGALQLLPGCTRAADAPRASSPARSHALNRPHDYWRDKVGPAAFAVLFNENTERAGSSPLDKEHRPGTFVCAACHQPLFASEHKFDSGTGWPSFTQPIAGSIGTRRDFKMILPRTEYHCARCGGHQGHVFKDGPPPRGERWCNNGVALRFVGRGEPLPALRG
ncbi:MAG: peptide-methionine (R)-S-oxide reductase MsrB [Pseudomonadota bacterium]|nr:peptide-methionine (R)-S-oxide reductase MsrB [Pseudomonadota bacterium]